MDVICRLRLRNNACPIRAEINKQIQNASSFPAKERGGFDVATITNELISSKRLANRRDVYLDSLKYYLGKFAEKYNDLRTVTPEQIELFLGDVAGYSRQTWLSRISTLFSFSVRKGYVQANPCDRIDRVTIDRKQPVILTVEQSKLLLNACSTLCRPYLILGMFAGIRPDEIHRLDWSDISLETKTVRVKGKTRRNRIVPLEPIAADLLAAHPIKTGPVAPSKGAVRWWKRKAKATLGGKWTADILRHTAASYLLAKHQDVGKVAMWLGNSPQILMAHYAVPITKADAENFWRSGPTKYDSVGLAALKSLAQAAVNGKTHSQNQPQSHPGIEATIGRAGASGAAQRELAWDSGCQNAA